MTATAIDKISYEDLYERWEKSNWRSTEIDFSQDRKDWHETFSDIERRGALWNYAMFFHGEDSVAENLTPYIDAAPKEEQKYFLATQQVDEARHAVFFGRFMREVVENGDSIAGSLAATKPELTWGFRRTFARLDRMADELRRDRSKPKFAQAITLYHMVIEAALAQPGQHFIETYLDERGVLPGFRAGMKNVSLDEQRHIGFGVKVLSELLAEDPECADAVEEILSEVTTYSVGVFVPPNWDMRYIECFGSTMEEVYVHGMQSLETKMRTAGFPIERLARAFSFSPDTPHEERARRAVRLLQANIVGEKNGPPSKDPEIMAMLFDSVKNRVDPSQLSNGGVTIQWDFEDADPWFLRVDNGATSVEQGRLEDPELTFRCRYEDWVDVAAGREDPRLAMAKRKLRPKGLLTLLRTRKLFG